MMMIKSLQFFIKLDDQSTRLKKREGRKKEEGASSGLKDVITIEIASSSLVREDATHFP
jgi:hypothetical protein